MGGGEGALGVALGWGEKRAGLQGTPSSSVPLIRQCVHRSGAPFLPWPDIPVLRFVMSVDTWAAN